MFLHRKRKYELTTKPFQTILFFTIDNNEKPI